MIITVLYAPDGSRVWAAFGKHDLYSAADLMEAMSRGETLPQLAAYIADLGVTFDAYVWDNEIRELAPGYRLEHYDLAELLARPTAEDLQAATTERDRLRVVVDELAQRGADGFRVSLGYKEPGRMVLAVTGPTDKEMDVAQLIVGLFKAAEATQAAADGEE
mgnify:CR=1 FL=1